MSDTAADVLVDCLAAYGVDVVFGLPGDGINGIMEALRRRRNDVRFIQVRHEEAAAFMACGYAKFTGRLGVCLATSGPGGIHLLNGAARAVQIDCDGTRIGLRYPVECGLVGDSAQTLRALMPLLTGRDEKDFLQTAQRSMQAWRDQLNAQAERRDTPMKPQVVAHARNQLLRNDAIIATDSGTNTLGARAISTCAPR